MKIVRFHTLFYYRALVNDSTTYLLYPGVRLILCLRELRAGGEAMDHPTRPEKMVDRSQAEVGMLQPVTV